MWSTDNPDGVASIRIVGASASVIFPCSIRWREVMEEVDKGCSEFCETVGWRQGVVVSGVRRKNKVNARRARLVLGGYTISVCNKPCHLCRVAGNSV